MTICEIIINDVSVKLIPLGDCACGCGGKTKISTQNRKQLGHKKGVPVKFIQGHHKHNELTQCSNNEKEKRLAKAAVSQALRNGLLKKLLLCQECGERKYLEGHHPNYLRKITVVWLCHSCHMKRHLRGGHLAHIARGGLK